MYHIKFLCILSQDDKPRSIQRDVGKGCLLITNNQKDYEEKKKMKDLIGGIERLFLEEEYHAGESSQGEHCHKEFEPRDSGEFCCLGCHEP